MEEDRSQPVVDGGVAPEDTLQGIVIANGRPDAEEGPGPRITAFIWGGKVRPTPTLPYGRWKGAA